MPKEIFKETRNLVDNDHPPKSIFSIEYKHGTYTFDNNHPFHYHDWYEFYYLKKGCCTYHIGTKRYIVNEGDWLFIPPKQAHKVLYHSSPHERYLMYFSKDFLPLVLDESINHFIANPVYTPHPEDAERMVSITHKILHEFNNPDAYSASLYKVYLIELFVSIIRTPSYRPNNPIEGEKDLLIAHILDYISYNYAQNISLEDLASENDISASYLSRNFKLATGFNLSEYVRRVRINQAKKLLVETNDSISAISAKCGFNDSNYFSYVFKESEHISPLKYRKTYS